MFDKIVYISDEYANVKLKDAENLAVNLMNLHLVFEDSTKKILAEVDDLNGDIVKASFLGEIVGDRFIGGTIRKPSLDANIRIISDEEIPLITGKDEVGYMKLGYTPFYDGKQVFMDVNAFFNSHFAVFGNSGSGKSCGTTRVFQNMFQDKRLFPYKSNIILFDSSGEYYNAFSGLNAINPNYHYRYFSTNEEDPNAEKLRIPIYLLNEDDLALLLQVTSHSQLPIIERMLNLARIFSQKDMDAEAYKNHLIAKAIMTILYTNETAPNKRNEIFSILASCSTRQFNLEAVVQGIGYTRKFRECFLIDNSGNFTESVLLTEYISSFIKEEYDTYEPKGLVYYDLDTLERAMNFTLISEGWLRNDNTYGDAVTLKVRLHSIVSGPNSKYFDVDNFMTLDTYLTSLLISNNRKYQIVNINLDDVDDDFAKVLTKIFSRLIFDFSKNLIDRASIPFHLVYEEAHRYIQNDNDRFLLGYNIFERIAKEGRKYGVILGIITQRPVELSDTVISQCSNFLIFRVNHPVDVDYIRKMVPNISDEIVEKQKGLQSGTCLGFGNAFKIPMIVKMEMPDPAPWSGSCDVVTFWNGGASGAASFRSDSPSDSKPANNASAAIPQINEGPAVPSVPSAPTSPTGSDVHINVPRVVEPSHFNENEKFDDSFVVTTGAKTLDDVKKQMEKEARAEQIKSLFFDPDDIEAAKAEDEEEQAKAKREEARQAANLVSLNATGGIMLAAGEQGVATQEIVASEAPSFADEKPNLINLVDESKANDEKKDEVTTEPTKVIDLPSIPSDADKKEEHKGLFHLGGKHEDNKEEMHLGTAMSSQAVSELISLSEEPVQNTGGDGFTTITSLDGSEVQNVNNGFMPIPPTDA